MAHVFVCLYVFVCVCVWHSSVCASRVVCKCLSGSVWIECECHWQARVFVCVCVCVCVCVWHSSVCVVFVCREIGQLEWQCHGQARVCVCVCVCVCLVFMLRDVRV